MKRFRAFLREERLDELSKSTLASYIKKSSSRAAHHAGAGAKVPDHDKEAKAYHKGKLRKRLKGIRKAANRLKRADKPKAKPLRPKKVPIKNRFGHQGVISVIARGISSGIGKGIIGTARRVLK